MHLLGGCNYIRSGAVINQSARSAANQKSIYPDFSDLCKLLNNSRTHTMKTMTKFGLLPIAALATVAAGTFMGAGSAEAAGLTGEFQFGGGISVPGGISTASLSERRINV